MRKFVYVFSLADKDYLLAKGYKLLKTDNRNNMFIFENKAEMSFDLGDMKYIDSDIMTF